MKVVSAINQPGIPHYELNFMLGVNAETLTPRGQDLGLGIGLGHLASFDVSGELLSAKGECA